MTAMSDVLENAVLDHVLRSTPLSTAGITTGVVYAALFTTPTTDTGGGVEVVGGSYTRVLIGGFTNPVSGSSNNSVVGTFPNSTASWGTVTHFALFDAVAVGNMLFHGPLTTPKVVNAGDTFVFPVGNITISMD
jgi:hypothetical protein